MAKAALKKRGAFLAKAAENVRICDEHYRLTLRLPAFPPSRPGQFIQLLCREPGGQVSLREVDWSEGRPPKFTQPELTDAQPLLRRPLSLAGRRDLAGGGVDLDVIYRVVGTGTRWLSTVKAGASLSVLGPLGNGFAIRDERPQAAIVGGGVGIPPMLYLAEALAAAGKQAAAFCGAKRASLLPVTVKAGGKALPSGKPTPCVKEFAANGIEAVVATDDGSLGFKGFISAAFERWLDEQRVGGDDLVVYCCGPAEMMRAAGDMCIARGIECQLALERHMACGMGTCQSCNVRIRDGGAPAGRGWSYKLCCTDGPVFDAREVIW
ncbi:MAG TPA: dihydroorotate dehydrogenase electron transfer subunit [Phycisphaerae bacterium]|nr:dihydroorotate dehydrogenase electron transfer subunit [Phycisphaerae bacterium]